MIVAPGRPDPPLPRLLETLARSGTAGSNRHTVALTTGSAPDPEGLRAVIESARAASDVRLLVLGSAGTHRDAKAPRLRALWDLEEQARGSGLPVLALRLGPLLGPESPLWLRLRSRPHLPSRGNTLLNPVAEQDVLDTIDRALSGSEWSGWYDVAGSEALTLAELADLAARAGALGAGAGAWEPPHEEMKEHRLSDDRPWRERFAIVPRRVSEEASRWR